MWFPTTRTGKVESCMLPSPSCEFVLDPAVSATRKGGALKLAAADNLPLLPCCPAAVQKSTATQRTRHADHKQHGPAATLTPAPSLPLAI